MIIQTIILHFNTTHRYAGKVANKLTICGDWAKIYQSIIGYDEILLSKTLDHKYKKNIIDILKNYFINKFSEQDSENIKIITKKINIHFITFT